MENQKNWKRKTQKALSITGFVAPALVIYGVYVVFSIGMTFYYSLFEWSGIDVNRTFMGLSNYAELLRDEIFWMSFKNNLTLVAASLLTQIPLGLIMALLISVPLRGMRFFRTVYFFPFLMSTVAIGILFIFIYDANYGMINQFLGWIGLESWQRGWLGEEDTALWAVIATVCWQYAPFYMILFRAAIVGIPDSLYEAAKIDGANARQRFFSVTLPLLVPTVISASILVIIGSLKYFDLIYVMTNGGPNNATELMATYMYKESFTIFHMGYGSSISFAMFVIAFLITLFVLSFDKKRRGEA